MSHHGSLARDPDQKHDSVEPDLRAPARTGSTLDRTLVVSSVRLSTTALTVGLVAAIVISCTLAGYRAWHLVSSHSAQAHVAADRDGALAAGRAGIQTLNTIDYHHARTGVTRWLTVSGGPLHARLQDKEAALVRTAKRAKTVSRTRVVAASLSTFHEASHRATVIAALKVTSGSGRKATTAPQRFTASLTKVAGRWTLVSMQEIGVAQ